MGNCALRPKVLSGNGAPAPEELKDSLLEYQKIDTAKSLSKLFLHDKVEKKDEKIITPETEDLKTALLKARSPTKTEAKSPTTKEVESPTEDAKPLTNETKSPEMDSESAKTEEKSPATDANSLAHDDVIVKETITETKTEEGVKKEA